MKIIDGKEQEYKDWYNKQSNGYGRACFTYAERWAEMMEAMIKDLDDAMSIISANANRLSHAADVEGITGFMYGCAVSILTQFWVYGEELRKWHNEKYHYDGDGVVNPAVMSVGPKA